LKAEGEAEGFVLLANAGLATSGDAYRGVEIGGVRYSHIVDPHTGIGLKHRSSVTIIAPNATTADALSTTVSVLGAERGLAFLEQFPGTSGRVVWQDAAGQFHERHSAEWKLQAITKSSPE
jgi:thiamine biosynthesis lipoprotein